MRAETVEKEKRGMKARGPEIQRMRGDWIMRRGENKVKSEDILIFIPVFEDELPSGLVARCVRRGPRAHVRTHAHLANSEIL